MEVALLQAGNKKSTVEAWESFVGVVSARPLLWLCASPTRSLGESLQMLLRLVTVGGIPVVVEEAFTGVRAGVFRFVSTLACPDGAGGHMCVSGQRE